jgi:uncharacterized membrane protein
MDLGSGDCPVVTLVEAHRELQLAQIGFHRRRHLGVLQFAGERGSVERGGPVHLPERSGARCCPVKLAKPAAPVGAELAGHAPPDKRPAHCRRVRLQLNQLLNVFFGQCVGDRREQLSHLHQRPFDAAEHRLELGRVAAAVEAETEIALAREPRREPSHRGRHQGVAAHAAGQRIVVSHER